MESKQPKIKSQMGQQELLCPMCGNAGITTSWNQIAFNYGSEDTFAELKTDVPVRRCETCDFDYLDKEAERLRHKTICRHLGVLSPDEIRQIRYDLKMTRVEFAEFTGIGEASLNRWENGLNIQTHAYDRYLRLLAARPEIMQEISWSSNPITSSLSERRFRKLKITDDLLKEQEIFKLSKAA